jgi:hypothetical protein
MWRWTPRHASCVPRSDEPGSGTASLALVGERVPGLELTGPAPEDVLEAAEGPATRDGDRQPIRPVLVRERLDEVLHIAVGGPGALAPHGEPAVGVLVAGIIVALFVGVVDPGLRPDPPGAKVDPPAGRSPSAASSWRARSSSPSQARSRSCSAQRRAKSGAPSTPWANARRSPSPAS